MTQIFLLFLTHLFDFRDGAVRITGQYHQVSCHDQPTTPLGFGFVRRRLGQTLEQRVVKVFVRELFRIQVRGGRVGSDHRPLDRCFITVVRRSRNGTYLRCLRHWIRFLCSVHSLHNGWLKIRGFRISHLLGILGRCDFCIAFFFCLIRLGNRDGWIRCLRMTTQRDSLPRPKQDDSAEASRALSSLPVTQVTHRGRRSRPDLRHRAESSCPPFAPAPLPVDASPALSLPAGYHETLAIGRLGSPLRATPLVLLRPIYSLWWRRSNATERFVGCPCLRYRMSSIVELCGPCSIRRQMSGRWHQVRYGGRGNLLVGSMRSKFDRIARQRGSCCGGRWVTHRNGIDGRIRSRIRCDFHANGRILGIGDRSLGRLGIHLGLRSCTRFRRCQTLTGWFDVGDGGGRILCGPGQNG